mgnify:CR=1 FL=1
MDIKERLELIRLSDVLLKSYQSELSSLLRYNTGLPAQIKAIETVKKNILKLETERITINDLINKLDNPLYQTILRLYYFDNMSFRDIAIKLYYHQKTIARYHHNAIENLKLLS